MLKKTRDDHHTFLLASLLWLLCYLSICLLVIDPLQLHQSPNFHSAFTWLMLTLAGFAMGVDLLWGYKELRNHEILARHGSDPQNGLSNHPRFAEPS